MNRRGFLKALISAAGAVAAAPYVPAIIREPLRLWSDWHQEMIDALAQSMIQTKEVITANVLQQAFSRSVIVYGDAGDAEDV
jgi:hypothetical protein